MEEERRAKNILKVSHSPNSPYLNMIEELWNYEKDQTDKYKVDFGICEDVAKTKAFVTKEWM